ncbi:oligosaccharide flippase family protein [Pseudomonas taiwanensis]|uniref:oligosaccharide flippase family protein n=1 Tax=Pseudomonas taiwanensis TaxID=470150 RepID=UPI0028DDFE10|nr:oligosaccharide flippase family protein [Pseudomonas taiwanensis]MDT8922064.1 oligosaccharide flippase family protein [Pseudomonas taiwanensis]
MTIDLSVKWIFKVSLKKNIIANYVSQIYVALIGVLILPIYIKYMGAESYGLIGFFTMLQAWFAVLDLGLTPTIGRETARFRAGRMSAVEYRRLFRALSAIFLVIAVLGGGSLLIMAKAIVNQWLSFRLLAQEEVVFSVQIMAICVALRWMGGLYRGVINGNERLVWLSLFNMFVASLRFLAVFASMYFYGFTATVFFVHQLLVAAIEYLGLLVMTRHLLPSLGNGEDSVGWSIAPVKPLLKFSLSIAFTSSVWVLVTQSDKLVLSGILPLAEYGHFTLAVLVAGGIMVLSGPVSNALLPRMARLYAENKAIELIDLYRRSTRFIAMIIGSVSIVLAMCAKPLLIIWTGDLELASTASPILTLYAWGNGFLALAAFPYYLQYAKGNLKYHLVGSMITVGVLIPAMVFSASKFGGIGAGWAWLLVNALFFFIWVTYTHYRLEPGLQWRWLGLDCMRTLVPTALVVWGVVSVMSFSNMRWVALLQVSGVGVVALIVSFVSSANYQSLRANFKRG